MQELADLGFGSLDFDEDDVRGMGVIALQALSQTAFVPPSAIHHWKVEG